MDNGNSNIDAFIENLPDGITYDLDVTANPLGDVSNGNDFLYDDSRLTADLDVDIPLNIIATDLTLTPCGAEPCTSSRTTASPSPPAPSLHRKRRTARCWIP